jgi:hypothetical protein
MMRVLLSSKRLFLRTRIMESKCNFKKHKKQRKMLTLYSTLIQQSLRNTDLREMSYSKKDLTQKPLKNMKKVLEEIHLLSPFSQTDVPLTLN